MAKALKTNARMLIYHFGSREGMMREILIGLREREDATIQKWLAEQKTAPAMMDFLLWYWERLSASEARPAALLIFEIYALALRSPEEYPGVLTDPLVYWRSLVARTGLREKGDDAQATLLLAATRGLLLDLTATNDRPRIRKALNLLTHSINASRSAE
jgi:AcrR family transcriptional regulator